MTAPTWLRTAMLATAVMNLLAAILFLPGATALRALVGLPEGAPAIYLATVALFVGLFGAGYLWVGVTGHADPLFVGLAGLGKLGFVTLVVAYWAAGSLPVTVPLTAAGDLFFAVLFLKWVCVPR